METDAVGVESVELNMDEIPVTDIQFDCPHCGKHLSIDQRGAGLVVVCTKCGKYVTVPIPEGLGIEDFDATPEELSFQLLNARNALSRTEAKLKTLTSEAEELKAFKEKAEDREKKQRASKAAILAKMKTAVKMQRDLLSLLESIIDESESEA